MYSHSKIGMYYYSVGPSLLWVGMYTKTVEHAIRQLDAVSNHKWPCKRCKYSTLSVLQASCIAAYGTVWHDNLGISL